MEKLIMKIEQKMIKILDNIEMDQLHKVLADCFRDIAVTQKNGDDNQEEKDYVEIFICAKRVEGCSERSLKYYSTTVKLIETEDIRTYLAEYFKDRNCSKVSLDNIRRIISSFFSWLEEESYIIKNPVRRIHKIKTTKIIKETYTDENIEILRDNCMSKRDLAIIDLLNSTGMRVGELVRLSIGDVNFNERECIVLGKGDKQRKVYFDARTKIHLQDYLKSRVDDNQALFVSLLKPYNRLHISGVEIRMRQLGRKLNIKKVHPHKFRRTLATRAIDKGMPIEQVQQLLGHQKIDTTMHYAMVNQNNVKIAHRKYIA